MDSTTFYILTRIGFPPEIIVEIDNYLIASYKADHRKNVLPILKRAATECQMMNSVVSQKWNYVWGGINRHYRYETCDICGELYSEKFVGYKCTWLTHNDCIKGWNPDNHLPVKEIADINGRMKRYVVNLFFEYILVSIILCPQ